ncbi:MAG: class I SAM-dependent methyltransferase [Bacteroidales bacterium]|nr:class I SAM-dependent methyltransferase [Bacteroidales bacterium]
MIINYLKFLITSNRAGYNIHSPYLFNFALKVLNNSANANLNNKIENIRLSLLNNEKIIEVYDLGAGSKKQKSANRKISNIAKYSLTSTKYCTFLQKTIEFTNAKKVLELGTSLGISSLYIKSAINKPEIHTVEGAQTIANIAKENFILLKKNIFLHISDFNSFFEKAIKENQKFDFFFIDGHHTKEATLRYFELAKKIMLPNSTFIFDDIRWSKGMYEAWIYIKNSEYQGASVELFKMGVIFFNTDFIQKSHALIRF